MRDLSYGYKMGKNQYATGQIVRCNNCGLLYVNPRQKGIEDSYINNGEDITYLTSILQRRLNAEKDLRLLERFKKGKRLLDIGCSCGVFLEIAKKKGMDVYGIELSSWACKLANQKGLNVVNKRLGDADFEDGFFDIITSWGSIEHFEDPYQELLNMRRLLKDDGLLCIMTPNIDSLPAKILGRKSWIFLGQHIYYFSKKTFSKLMEKAGFRVKRIENYSYKIQLFYFANALNRYPILHRMFSGILNQKAFRNIVIDFKYSAVMTAYATKEI